MQYALYQRCRETMLDVDKGETNAKTFRELIVQHRRALVASLAFMFMMIVSNQVEEEVSVDSYLDITRTRGRDEMHVCGHMISTLLISR